MEIIRQFNARVVDVKHEGKTHRVLVDAELLALAKDPDKLIASEIKATIGA